MKNYSEFPDETSLGNKGSESSKLTATGNEPIVVQGRVYRDVAWLILFVIHLVVTAALLIAGAVNWSKHTSVDNGTFIIHANTTSTELEKLCGVSALSAGVGLALSFVWSLCMKTWPEQIIYIGVLLQAALWGAASVVFFVVGVWFAGAVFAFVALLQLLLLLIWRSRIPFAREMLREVVTVANEFPATLGVAYLSLVLLVGWYVVWVIAIVLVQRFSNAAAVVMSIYLLFSFYWVVQVIKNVVHVTVSGLFATVYFLRGSGLPFPANPTLESLQRAATTSLGSICLGSLIVAVLQTLRTLVRMIRGRRNNIVLVILSFCAECILSILDRLMQYFNHWAFTQVAIYGKTFCQASQATWDLIHTHGLEAIINDNLISYVLSAGCLAGAVICAAVSGFAAYAVVREYWILAIVLGFGIGYTTFAMPAEVIWSGVASSFVCFAQNPEILQRNNPSLYQRLVSTYSISWV